MQRNKLHEFFILIYRCSIVFFVICFFASIIGSSLVFFKFGYFEFNWKENIFISAKKGIVIGVTLGAGLWIKAWLQERKN